MPTTCPCDPCRARTARRRAPVVPVGGTIDRALRPWAFGPGTVRSKHADPSA